MFYWMFTPLDQQFDSGLGSMAHSFASAATRLDDDEQPASSLNPRLPICYLYRHSLELFLKSCITILHRVFKLPTPPNKDQSLPYVKVGDDWRPLHAVHSVQTLFDHFCVMLQMLAEPLGQICQTNIVPPPKASQWIKTIEETDARSTYFRYPVTREMTDDAAKSSMKKISPEALLEKTKATPSEVNAFVLVDDEGNPAEAFGQDDSALDDVQDALKQAIELFEGLHAAMRAELTGGW